MTMLRSFPTFASLIAVAASPFVFVRACDAQMSPGLPSTEQTSGATTSGAMSAAKPMSADDMVRMKGCNAMQAEEMAKHADCMDMMHAHPDMMKHPSMTRSGG